MSLLFHLCAAAAAAGPMVRTNNGIVEGRVLPSKVSVFHGIPFAEPPEKELRWKR